MPACQAMLAGSEVFQDPAGERPAKQAGNRNCRHEQGHDPPTSIRREPAREVQHHAWEEASFRGSGEQAQGIELGGGGDEQQAGREAAPGDHHHRDPAPRAEAVERQVAGQAAEHIADEEDAGAKAIDGFAEFQCVEHLQLGKADVDAVQVVEQVADENERNQPQGDAPVERVAADVLALVRGRAVCHDRVLCCYGCRRVACAGARPDESRGPRRGCLCAFAQVGALAAVLRPKSYHCKDR